jgi:hypothetical protein
MVTVAALPSNGSSPQKGGTFVSIKESGWTGDGDEPVRYATSSTPGFAWTLAGLKAWLEHKLRLNLVRDRFPKALANAPEGFAAPLVATPLVVTSYGVVFP